MNLYTGKGDDGSTHLFGEKRVDKDCRRVEAYGTVDELNSQLGLALCACEHDELRSLLIDLQNRLFDLGADLASPGRPPSINGRHAHELERHIDRLCEPLPELKNFVLPGGVELAARLHVARTIARRAERRCVSLNKAEPIGDATLVYLNRVSDLLFAMARRANQLADVEDVPWGQGH